MSESESVYVHPQAINECSSVGNGTRIWAFAHVLEGATIGENCNLGEHVFVESGARLGNGITVKNSVAIWEGVTLQDFVFVGPSAVFTNDLFPRSSRNPIMETWGEKEHWLLETTVEAGASIGANATILCGLTIGRYALVGAGAVVIENVPAHALVVGHPAKVIGYVCACGQRLDPTSFGCGRCGNAYQLTDDGLAES